MNFFFRGSMSVSLPASRTDGARQRYVALVLGAALISVNCAGPTDASGPSSAIELSGPASILVNETYLLTVSVKDAHGTLVRPTQLVRFTSDNVTVATVSSDGVVKGVGRGTATIYARRDEDVVGARLTITVRARVILTTANLPSHDPNWSLTVGDRMRLTAEFADVNGGPIGPAPTSAWQSSNPTSVSVDSAGFVVAQKAGQATVTASTPEGTATAWLQVYNVVPGSFATVRFAHAAQGVGPITFLSNKLAPVTLQYGQSVDLPASYGTFDVEAAGLPKGIYGQTSYSASLGADTRLSLYAVAGDPTWGSLIVAWGSSNPIPADSGLVRLIQGTGFAFPVFYLRPTGAPRSGVPEQCYFDPGDATGYYSLAGGSFDLILQQKPAYYFDSTAAFVRLPASVRGGHAITLVLTGAGLSTAGYLAFDDR